MGDVKFIRKGGRIIPIRSKGDSGTNKKKAEILKVQAANDREHAKTGRKVAGVSALAGVAAAGLAVASKRFRVAGLIGAGIGGFGALLNSGFASGREMAAKNYDQNAHRIMTGKKPMKSGFGGAADRAYQTSKFVGKMNKKQADYFHKVIVKGKSTKTSA